MGDAPVSEVEVVVVGGGVAGCALAAVLAEASISVVVLEREEVFRDRVRGEWIAPWGVFELDEIGLRHVVEGVPFANWLERAATGDETIPADFAGAHMASLAVLPGIPGCLSLGHADLQERMLDEAVRRGARVVRGVRDIATTLGARPEVSYSSDGRRHTVSAQLVVGADGRESGVRRAAGLTLSSTTARVNIAGMLVEGVHGWPKDVSATGVEDDLHFLIFPQASGRMRLYATWDVQDRQRFAGPDRQQRFLNAFRLRCVPGSDEIADATPAGPCVTVPMTDTWTDTVAVDGAVLIGDAAGWSDPTIGQGLSVTFRDVHLVADLLTAHTAWTTELVASYAAERAERMRRLRFANAVVGLAFDFGEQARARRVRLGRLFLADPLRYSPLTTVLTGPWRSPDDAFTDDTWNTLIAA